MHTTTINRPKTGRFAAAFVRGAQVRNEVAAHATREEVQARHSAERNAHQRRLLITIHFPTGRSARGVPRGTAHVCTVGGSPVVAHLNATREALEELRDKVYASAWCLWLEGKPKAQTAQEGTV
jgi:hypothetical protein